MKLMNIYTIYIIDKHSKYEFIKYNSVVLIINKNKTTFVLF